MPGLLFGLVRYSPVLLPFVVCEDPASSLEVQAIGGHSGQPAPETIKRVVETEEPGVVVLDCLGKNRCSQAPAAAERVGRVRIENQDGDFFPHDLGAGSVLSVQTSALKKGGQSRQPPSPEGGGVTPLEAAGP